MNAHETIKRIGNQGFSVFVAAVLIASSIPSFAFADENIENVNDVASEGKDTVPSEATEAVPAESNSVESIDASEREGVSNENRGDASGITPFTTDENGTAQGADSSDSSLENTMTEAEIEETLQPLFTPTQRLYSNDANPGRSVEPVTYLYGDDRFQTAAAEALYAYPSGCKTVIVVSGVGNAWADALSATGLAGALNSPILFVTGEYIPQATSDAIAQLGASEVILIGGTNVVATSVETELGSLSGVSSVRRVWGADRFATQLAIYEFGLRGYDSTNHWNSDMVLVASGINFPDALSASSLAFAERVPMFLVSYDGDLPIAQKQALVSAQKNGVSSFATSVIVGLEAAVSKRTEGFMWGITQLGSGASKATIRLGGPTRFETSALFAQWCADQNYLSWNNAAFASGETPWDALAGSAVQGKDRSMMLLASDASSATVAKAVENASGVDAIKFFGGNNTIPARVKSDVLLRLNILANVVKWDCGVSLDAMVAAEVNSKANGLYTHYTRDQIMEYLEPSNFLYGTAGYYQHARLTDGYSGKVSASQLDAYISSVPKGATGMLAGMGQSFINAAQQTGVNEVYLLAHAILESGWGTSELAVGYSYAGGEIDGDMYPAGTYYNFFGIGAYDSSPLSGGRKLAILNGWDTPEKAIIGAAEWIKRQYLANGYGPQNTLYKMKWDFYHVKLGQDPWKQYATSRTWAHGISTVMNECYKKNGIAMGDTGLNFEYPVFN